MLPSVNSSGMGANDSFPMTLSRQTHTGSYCCDHENLSSFPFSRTRSFLILRQRRHPPPRPVKFLLLFPLRRFRLSFFSPLIPRSKPFLPGGILLLLRSVCNHTIVHGQTLLAASPCCGDGSIQCARCEICIDRRLISENTSNVPLGFALPRISSAQYPRTRL